MRISSRRSLVFQLLLLQCSDIGIVSAIPSQVLHSACAPEAAAQSFDYLIVGGGTAGLVLANRLTENADLKVAVIEAGTNAYDIAGNWTQVPGYAGKFNYGAPELSWGFDTTPQKNLLNRTFEYYRAKALGGCSVRNFMAYSQTSRGAHQKWADEVGDSSYLYDNMVQYYDKTMNFSLPMANVRIANATPMYDTTDLAAGGGLDVTYAPWVQSWSTWVSKGLEAIGVPQVDAYVDGNLLGQTWQLNTISASDSYRSYATTGYLDPIADRSNLEVFEYTLAERIIFSNNKTATGVQVKSSTTNCSYTLSASKEVIISTGALQSPQLLMVSGVGPKDTLQKFNIDVVADRPGVGQGMHDHLTSFVEYEVDVVTNSALNDADYLAAAVEEFNNNHQGPLASAGGDLVGMENLPQEFRAAFSNETKAFLATFPEDWPEIAFNVYPSGLSAVDDGKNYALLQATLLVPKSRGTIDIQSASMSDAPLINPNWLDEQVDLEVLTAGFRRVRQALGSSAMAPVLIGSELYPGPNVTTDAQIQQFLREVGNPIYHAFATNKMGKTSDPDAVVDNRGKVIGVHSLRVIDSSSFPFLPPGPAPQIQVYTLAEKLADDIKNTIY